ncbi:MAG: TolC family protein [Thermodesulfobacteriota bacterium]
MKKKTDSCRQAARLLQLAWLSAFSWVMLFYPAGIYAGPLTLEQCLETALSRNPEIAQSRQALEAARSREDSARAGLFPEVKLDAATGYRSEITTTRQEAITIPTGAGSSMVIPAKEIEIGDNTTTDLSASLWQPIYTGGALNAGLDAARAARAGADLHVELKQRDIRRQVIAAFYDLAVAKEFEKIAEASVVRITGHLNDAQNMLDQGVILKSDLLPIRMRKLDTELKLVEARNAVARAGAALARSMGLPPQAGVDIVTAWDNSPPWPLPEAYTQPRTRLEQKIADRQIAAAGALARVEQGSRRPTVGVTTSAHYGWPGFVSNDPDWDTWWQAGISASWPIFDMGRRGSREQAALAEKRQMERALDALDGRIAQERVVSRLAYEEACRRREITAEKVETARENYRTQEDHFKVGIATNTDYLDAHTDLLAAEFDLAAARARVRVAWNDYLTAMGLEE